MINSVISLPSHLSFWAARLSQILRITVKSTCQGMDAAAQTSQRSQLLKLRSYLAVHLGQSLASSALTLMLTGATEALRMASKATTGGDSVGRDLGQFSTPG